MKSDTRSILIILALVVVAVLFYTTMTTREDRTMGERLDAATQQLDEGGVDDAARELQDRTPAQRIEDEYNDALDRPQTNP